MGLWDIKETKSQMNLAPTCLNTLAWKIPVILDTLISLGVFNQD